MNFNFSGVVETIIIDEEKTIDNKKILKCISSENNIYNTIYDDTVYTNDILGYEKYLKEFMKYFRHDMILLSYNELFINWFSTIEEKSKKLMKDLNNTNEVFWRQLRIENELWQLLFLKEQVHTHNVIIRLRRHNKYYKVLKEKQSEWKKNINDHKDELIGSINEVKYALNNLSTPGHTHDEQSLQTETEKVNERILLLSFLAMSIPLFGAIISPDLSINIKISAAIFIITIPIIYFSSRKISKSRKERRNSKKYIGEIIKETTTFTKQMELDLDKLKNSTKLSPSDKEQQILLGEKNINANKKIIHRIRKQLKNI